MMLTPRQVRAMEDRHAGDETGLAIKTERGWKRIGGPMQPVPPVKKWWRYASEGQWEALFTEPRIT